MDSQRKVLSVSQLNRESRFLLEKHLSTLWVEGEISNLARPASGHIYFTLKDAGAQIRCAMFRNRLNYLRFRPENGAQVQIRGSVSLYEARGDYQLIAEHMEPSGEGALQLAFEQLKKKLALEGLFDESHKQPIPPMPRRIGVVTSPSGAAIHDILTVLARRFPSLAVVIYPTAVQGEGAAAEIVHAIETAATENRCDLLIVGRGGGSIEDLWSFNEETVARAIYHCPLPILSAVGHETDITIADFVADQRAATPSAAAESISPDQEEWLQGLQQLQQRFQRAVQRKLQIDQQRVTQLEQRLRHPGERIQQYAQRLDEGELRLQRAQQRLIQRKRERLQQQHHALQREAPARRVAHLRQRLQGQHQQLQQAIHHRLQHHQERLAGQAHILQALSPLSTLSRGYSITLNQQQQALLSSDQVSVGEQLETRLQQGHIISKVVEVNTD